MTDTANQDNPLLEDYDLAPFDKIKPDHVVPAIEKTLCEHKQAIEHLLSQSKAFTWESLMQPLEKLSNQLDKRWSPISHLNAVVNSDELRSAYDQCLPLLSEFYTWLGQNKALYEAVKQLDDNRDILKLDSVQQKIIADELRDFILAGVALPKDKQQRYAEIQTRLSTLSSKYAQNILDATMAWNKHITDAHELDGLPESSLALLEQNAKQADLDGYLINLEFPSYYAVITYANNRELREEVYRAYVTRASELSEKGKFDNQPIMDETLKLRQELAELLGFANYAELSIATKMAGSTEEVEKLLSLLAEKSKPQATREREQLADFAATELSIDSLEAWDVSFAAEKLKQQRFSISDEELKPYFPVEQVIEGLFAITEKLFSVKFNKVDSGFAKWHSDVSLYQVLDENGSEVAKFYLDLFARKHKRGGAWMADFCGRFRVEGERYQLPIAFLTCNFNPPVGDKPALLTHDEVVTLFHEFGHGLHHMLTQINHLSVSGINGVEWDAVELPSQFMENFCYQKEGLEQIAKHYKTGESLPDHLLNKLIEAKNFQSAMMMVRQLEFSLFDWRIHSQSGLESVDIQQTLDSVRDEVAVFTPPDWNRFQHSFSHIFAGGYAAGYYSYKWAEVLSADAFSLFEEQGIFNPKIGEKFKQAVLERGGSALAKDLFVEFRGREPDVAPLLRHCGIAA